MSIAVFKQQLIIVAGLKAGYNKIIKMNSNKHQANFVYEEKNEVFQQYRASEPYSDNGIGKIIAKYRSRHSRQSISNEQVNSQPHPLTRMNGLNYSQLYNELKIEKDVAEPTHKYQRASHQTRYSAQQQQQYQQPTAIVSKDAYNFHSAAEMRNTTNKKILPGLIKHSGKANSNADFSFQSNSKYNDISDDAIMGDANMLKKPKVQKYFRITDTKQRKNNFIDVSDLSINGLHENKSQYQSNSFIEHSTRNDYKSGRQEEEHGEQTSNKVISGQQVLGNSRSVGVGNHRVQKKDLEQPYENQSQGKNSPIVANSKATTPRNKLKDNSQQRQEEANYLSGIQKNKKVQQIDNYNPEKQVSHRPEIRQNIEKSKQINNNFVTSSPINDEHRKSQQVMTHKETSPNVVHFERKQPIEEQLQQNESKVINHQKFSGQVLKADQSKQRQKQGRLQQIQIGVSRVASSIKPSFNQQEQLNIPFDPLTNQPQSEEQAMLNNDHEQILDALTASQHQPKEQKPHQPVGPIQQALKQKQASSQVNDYMPSRFNIEEYNKVFEILKSIQTALKAAVINVHDILRAIKAYLQIIAAGNLDNIDQFDLPLHKKKIIKNSLFLERVAVIVLAFCYTTHSVKDSLKYLLNIMGYSLNNCLILVKILQQTQIQTSPTPNSSHSNHFSSAVNPLIQKSDRLLMKRNLDTLRNNNNVLLDAVQKLSKSEQVFYENLSHVIKLISKTSLQQTFYNLLEYFSFYLCVSENEKMIPFLAVAPNPYFSPTLNPNKYCLVIDVIQLFCVSKKPSKSSSFRPYTQHFLQEMSQYYEIISFCPMFPNQIDKIIDMLDPKGFISKRLYKHHTISNNGNPIKCIDRVGRDLSRTLLLDNENGGGQGSYQNCVHVPMWKGSKNDMVLAELCPLLAMIALKKLDAAHAANKFREQMLKNKKEGVKYINFGISLD